MDKRNAIVLPLALTFGLLAGCSEKDDADLSESSSPEDVAVNPGPGGSGDSNGSFFNADGGLDFANSLGESMSRMFNTATSAGDGDLSADSQGSVFTARASETSSTACDSGSVDSVVTVDDITEELTAFNLQFNDCMSAGSLSTGSIDLAASGTADDMQMSIIFDNFSSTDSAGSSAMNGTINVSGSENSGISNFTISGPSLTMVSDGETLSFDSYSLTVLENSATSVVSMSVSATIDSSTDGTLSLSIDPPFVQDEVSSDYPESGRMVMSHSDGSSLEIQADNGSAESFDYIVNDNGIVTSGTELWANSDLLVE